MTDRQQPGATLLDTASLGASPDRPRAGQNRRHAGSSSLRGYDEMDPSVSDASRPAHASTEMLSAYLDGRAEPVEARFVAAHLTTCQQCRDDLEGLRTVRDLLRCLPTAVPPRDFRIPTPARILRFPRLVVTLRSLASVAVIIFVLAASVDALSTFEARRSEPEITTSAAFRSAPQARPTSGSDTLMERSTVTQSQADAGAAPAVAARPSQPPASQPQASQPQPTVQAPSRQVKPAAASAPQSAARAPAPQPASSYEAPAPAAAAGAAVARATAAPPNAAVSAAAPANAPASAEAGPPTTSAAGSSPTAPATSVAAATPLASSVSLSSGAGGDAVPAASTAGDSAQSWERIATVASGLLASGLVFAALLLGRVKMVPAANSARNVGQSKRAQ
ncbi:MAG: zf-HC2 domain-containing protein [Chloroflexi bacterium]|nr:zf-HC2 domain-containing protein [Chloroflexota bacterium]